MKWLADIFTNPFSGKTYTETDAGIVSQEGRFFTKLANGYISDNGRFIQQVGNDLMDTQTGKMSSFSDPFEE